MLSVTDNGVGIAAPMLPRIFEMFAQADATLERSGGGLGIGLSLSRRLVEMHGGTLEAFSEGAGKGSRFDVRLPLASPAAEQAPEAASTGPRRRVPARRVLVVDDNRDAADSLVELLRLEGHDVAVAYDGVEALEMAERLRPEVVLMDLGLPRLNGYDAARRLREQPWAGGVVLVAVTGWGQENDRLRSRQAGFDHHIVKPIDPLALAELVVPAS